METNEALIAQILNDNKESIKSKLKEEIEKQIIDSLSWRLRDEIGKMTSEFMEAEMKADIKKLLIEHRPVFIEQLKDSFIKIGAQLSTVMVTQAMKNLEVGSYNAKDIVKKILD